MKGFVNLEDMPELQRRTEELLSNRKNVVTKSSWLSLSHYHKLTRRFTIAERDIINMLYGQYISWKERTQPATSKGGR